MTIKEFVNYWTGRGYEKGESQKFWLMLLGVLGVENPGTFIEFEDQVKLDATSFIDGMIPSTHVMIEQKSLGKNLDAPIRQSDGTYLTPFQQAKRYSAELPYSQRPRWIITCNFSEFYVYDMEQPGGTPEKIFLKDLEKEQYRLSFIVRSGNEHLKKELRLSIEAGEIVGLLYDAFLPRYKDPESEETLRSLNILCVRLVFCLYAEDSGIFGDRDMFRNYLSQYRTRDMRRALIDLFEVLDQPTEKRDPYLDDELAAFPYVNGGLFREEQIEIPQLTDEIRDLLIDRASDFDWSDISPTIFGAVFESTLNPETRRSGGMHYTSIENIHKVIDPLFLDGLKERLEEIKGVKEIRKRKNQLTSFQTMLSELKFLDPAAGSGNFLTETYLCLRRLENEVLKELYAGQMILGQTNPIKVSIDQFYGVEINDFAVSVAKTALWIAESQMMEETERIVLMNLDFLPLKTNANIVKGNALRFDWNEVIPNTELSYIMGNPPFVGNSRLTESQKKDRKALFSDREGELDYVSCWYKKAADYIQDEKITCAFVSTNSICQGQQVAPLWRPLFDSGIHIDFAYPTFVWDSEASVKAHVYCVIIGFSRVGKKTPRLYSNNAMKDIPHINAYLAPADDVFIEKRSKPLMASPMVIKGFQPTDNGNLILDDKEKEALILEEPKAEKWIRPFITAREFISQKTRWCIWLVGASPADINSMPVIKKRVMACKEWREQQVKTGDAYKLKDAPALMRKNSKFKEDNFIVLPRVSGERRRYVPFGFVEKGAIPGDSIMLALGASTYHFGILCSNVHMAWMRAVCGRLKGDYRYSSDIVYNNFPWPDATKEQKMRIEETAQAILDARALYPDSSLANLYDPITMPPELIRAHQKNDIAVMNAYGFPIKDFTEEDCVAELFKLYKEKVSQ